MTAEAGLALHATVVVVGEAGVLIEGPSGAGKSALADALVAAAGTRGRFARLVGDDRVFVNRPHDRLVARPHPAVAGLVERRGIGLVAVAHEPACVLALAVALVEGAALERLPDPPPVRTVNGVGLPQVRLWAGGSAADGAARVIAALGGAQPFA